MRHYVYTLYDPLTVRPRYVGVASCEFASVIRCLRETETQVGEWLRDLAAHGARPFLFFAGEAESLEAAERLRAEHDRVLWLRGNDLLRS